MFFFLWFFACIIRAIIQIAILRHLYSCAQTHAQLQVKKEIKTSMARGTGNGTAKLKKPEARLGEDPSETVSL